MSNTLIPILMADDDEDDRDLTRDALEEAKLSNPLYFVEDGQQLVDYLKNRPPYTDVQKYPKPGLILLDLNMPVKDGRTALMEIKSDPELAKIPIVIMTTSKEDEDIYRSYELGANSFITKPVQFSGLVEVIRSIGNYWFSIVALPKESGD